VSDRLSDQERRQLLALARGAIAARLGRPGPECPAPSGTLLERRGAFVTLRRQDGELRGCVGFSEARFPLHEAVERAALLAAFEDGRFDPVRAEELDGLVLDISILSPLRPVAPEDVEVGRDGLMIRHAGRSGLLLPPVPLQWGWDREEFLQHLCLKAGLPRDSWRMAGAELLAFSAELVEEREPPPA
jgi:AmmeMemoRadiSam system protein A